VAVRVDDVDFAVGRDELEDGVDLAFAEEEVGGEQDGGG